MKKILVSGGVGFIGTHILKYILETTDWEIVCLDRYDTSGNINRLPEFVTEEQKKRIKVVYHDLKAPINEFTSKRIGKVDHVLHLAASSHVDRSIADPLSFIMDNVVGTTNLLIWAKDGGMKKVFKNLIEEVNSETTEEELNAEFAYTGKFINFSTDESLGAAPLGINHKEDSPHLPSNPYAASKAGQEDIGYSFFITYGLPVITTHTMNNFGEMQHPEKLVPKTIRSVIEGTPMPIFAKLDVTGQLKAVGSRFWLHCKNTASAVMFLFEKGNSGESYNIIGFDELTNLEMAEKIAAIVGKPLIYKFVDVYKVRNGHDARYSLDGSKMRDMGWKPIVNFEDSLKETVEFTIKHPEWI